jgi:Fe-S-cluster containining protein
MTATLPRFIGKPDLKPGESLCDHCVAKCCKYYALPLETPTEDQDWDFMRWYLVHGDTCLFTEDGTWYLLVYNQCKHLMPDNRCGIYETRPQICREYSTDACEFDDRYVYDQYFETAEQFSEYIEALRAVDGRGNKSGSIRSPEPALLPVIG